MSTSRLRAAVVGAVLGAVAVAGMVGSAYQAPEAAATAQTVHRAGVVVEGYAPRCITFSSESVSGTQALQLAGFSPTIRSYSGEGGAVCAINGTGCAADANCLTCAAPNYWAYFRSDAGSGGFTYSSGAATSSQVTDGDVEGWRWGTGAAPGYVSFADACPITTPTTTSTTSPPSGGNTGGGNGNGGGGDPGGSTTGSNSGGAPGGNPGGADGRSGGGPDGGPTTTAGGPTTTTESTAEDEADTSSSGDEAEEVDGEEAAAVGPVVEDDSGGGGAGTWVLFAALLAGFGLVGWRVRSVRSRSS